VVKQRRTVNARGTDILSSHIIVQYRATDIGRPRGSRGRRRHRRCRCRRRRRRRRLRHRSKGAADVSSDEYSMLA